MESLLFSISYRWRIWKLAVLKFPKAVKLFKNPILGTIKIMFGKTPLIVYKDGHTFKSYDPFKFYDIRSQPSCEFLYNYNGKEIRIIHAERGEVEEVFVHRGYSWLPVKDRIVLDIGANIGDSAIFFALNGAEHVYAFEVVPSTAQLCRENVMNNGLEEKVTVINEGIGKPGRIKIPSNIRADGGYQVRQDTEGDTEVEIKSLTQIIDELKITDAVMKIDCEGCEYDVISPSNIDSLRKFSHIMGEYHYGFDSLKKTLEKTGFECFFSKPEPFYSPVNTPKECWTGLFMASRKLGDT
jgi:FkbM family methyltransferase